MRLGLELTINFAIIVVTRSNNNAPNHCAMLSTMCMSSFLYSSHSVLPRTLNVGLPYVLLLEDMSSFLTKNNSSSEDVKKCPNVLLLGFLSTENMSNHVYTKSLRVLAQIPARERDDLFFLRLTFFLLFARIRAENRTSEDVMTFKVEMAWTDFFATRITHSSIPLAQ